MRWIASARAPALSVRKTRGGRFFQVRGEDSFRMACCESAPLSDEPACTRTGHPWGGRGTLSGPRTESAPQHAQQAEFLRCARIAPIAVIDDGVVAQLSQSAGQCKLFGAGVSVSVRDLSSSP